MSITPYEAEQEAAYEAFVDDVLKENRDIIIDDFTLDRLKSYYLKNNFLLKPAFNAIEDAKNYIKTNETASFIFAAIAIEVGLKSALLKPIVYGLVHTEEVASLITDLALSQTGFHRYKLLLFDILKQNGSVDLETYKRLNSTKSLWEEIQSNQKKRNRVVHRGERANKSEAEFALNVALEILNSILPKLLNSIDLILEADYKISPKQTESLKLNRGIFGT